MCVTPGQFETGALGQDAGHGSSTHTRRLTPCPATTRCARRYAWSVFAVLFALMVVDYVDRQVVVSMFSHLKDAVGSLGQSAGRAGLGGVRDGRARGRAAVAACGPLEPRQEHLPHGADLEPRDHCLRVRRELLRNCSPHAAWSASARRPTVRSGPRCSPRCFRRACAARCSGHSSRPACWDRCSAWSSVASSPSTGDGRLDSAPSGIPGLFLALLFVLTARDYKTVALPTAAAGGPPPAKAVRRRGCGIAAPAIGARSPASVPACSSWPSRRSMRGCRATSIARMASHPTRPA